MHVVIVGCGRVGSALARSLTEGGHTVAVIDKRPEAFGRLPSDFSGQMINGIGFDRDRLKEAGIEQAASLAAVTNGDNSNILIARVARETFGIENVVARIYDPRRAAIYQRLGIATVATVAWTTERVMRRLVPSEAAMEWIDPSARVSLVERTIAGSWSGHPLSDLEQPGRVRVAAVGRLGVAQVPNPDLVAQDGDVVYLAVASDALADVDAALGGRSGKGSALMRVVIAGGGSVGRFIGQQLSEAKHEVLIIDNDPAVVRAAERSGEPAGVPWLQADACEATRLSEAQVDKADVVAAVTGDDEDNLVISLLAKQEFGVPRVVARVNNPKNEWMFNQTVGGRRRRLHPASHHRPRAGGGLGGVVRAVAVVRGRQGSLGRGDAGRGLAGGRQGDRRARPPARRHGRGHRPSGAGGRAPGRHHDPRR